MSDPIQSPAHYTSRGGIEPLDFIMSNNLGFAEGNIIKYVFRYREKNGIEDLRKARVYLDRLIMKLKQEQREEPCYVPPAPPK